jgi:hypothetical protein
MSKHSVYDSLKHIESWSELTAEEKTEYPNIISELEQLLVQEVKAERVYIPDLDSRVTILDKNDGLITHLGQVE